MDADGRLMAISLRSSDDHPCSLLSPEGLTMNGLVSSLVSNFNAVRCLSRCLAALCGENLPICGEGTVNKLSLSEASNR